MRMFLEILFFVVGAAAIFLGFLRLCIPGYLLSRGKLLTSNNKQSNKSKSNNWLGSVLLIVVGISLIVIGTILYRLAYYQSLYQ